MITEHDKYQGLSIIQKMMEAIIQLKSDSDLLKGNVVMLQDRVKELEYIVANKESMEQKFLKTHLDIVEGFLS